MDTIAEDNFRAIDAAALFRKYGPMVLRRCNWLLGDAEAAADAMQEVFAKLFEKRHTLQIKYPSGFLVRMATTHCLNIIRERTPGAEAVGDEALLLTIACSDKVEDHIGNCDLLRKLFGEHPKSSREIAVLHYLDGMTLEETAREVGMSVSGVRRRLRELRKTLAKMDWSI